MKKKILIWSDDDRLEASCYDTVEQRKKIIETAINHYPISDGFSEEGIDSRDDFSEYAYSSKTTFIEELAHLDLLCTRFDGRFYIKEIDITDE